MFQLKTAENVLTDYFPLLMFMSCVCCQKLRLCFGLIFFIQTQAIHSEAEKAQSM